MPLHQYIQIKTIALSTGIFSLESIWRYFIFATIQNKKCLTTG